MKEKAKERVRSRGGDADGETMRVEILQLKSGDFRYSCSHFGHDSGCTQLSDPDGAELITFRVSQRTVYFLIIKLLALANSIAAV